MQFLTRNTYNLQKNSYLAGFPKITSNVIIYQKGKGEEKLDYEKIAEMVHNLVKNPKSMPLYEQGLPSCKILTSEFSTIQRVFSKYEVSGDVGTLGVIPEGMWA